MKDKINDETRLKHILDCALEIEGAVSGKDESSFVADHVLRIAVVKWLEIIGEASVHVSHELKEQYPEVSWAEIRGLRNIVVHEYFGIKFDLIWEVASVHVPIIKEQMNNILNQIQ